MEYDKLRAKMHEDRQTYVDENGDYWAVGNMDNFTGAVKGIAIDKLAEIENKIENGTLVELPCKVGDTVYSNERIMFEAVIVKVITTHQSMNLPVSYTVFATAKDGYGIYLSSENFNKDWFLTREEAEKRLEELKNG